MADHKDSNSDVTSSKPCSLYYIDIPERSKFAPSTNLRICLLVNCLQKAHLSFPQRRHKANVRWEDLDASLGGWSVGGNSRRSFLAVTSHVVYCSGTLRALTKLIDNEKDSNNQIS